jgi:hypothetical protein
MPDYPHETLLKLLDLQAEDTALRRLEERRATLPEAQELEKAQARLSELESDLTIATRQNDEIGRDQSRFEGEIELLDSKITKDEQRVFSGAISSPKELSALQASIEQEKRQKSALEDQLLEVMEQKEQAVHTLEKLTGERDDFAARAEELSSQVSLLTGDIGADFGTHQMRREQIVPAIPGELLTLYDKLREQKAGVGVAVLRGGTCEGCHTKLPQAEWERIREEKGLQRCENCRRILVIATD